MNYSDCITPFLNSSPPNVRTHLEALEAYGIGLYILGAAITVTLFVFFILSLIVIIRRVPSKCRRCLTWVLSLPWLASLFAVVTIVVPRAGDLCDTVKHIYLPFILMHFVELSVVYQGGNKATLQTAAENGETIPLWKPPCCCWSICFRSLHYSKKRLRFFKGLVYQMPLVQFVLLVLILIMDKAELLQRGNLSDAFFMCLVSLNIVCFYFGIWSFNIIVATSAPRLQHLHYIRKASLLQLFITLMKTQNFILIVVLISGAHPCLKPYVSAMVLRRTIDASLTLLESFIFGVLFFFQYRSLVKVKIVQNAELTKLGLILWSRTNFQDAAVQYLIKLPVQANMAMVYVLSKCIFAIFGNCI